MAGRLFDTSLRVDAAGPRGVALANNFAFLGRAPRYLLRRLDRFGGQSVIP